jgi:DNA-binding MarR family transcriptional regulator
MERAAARDEKEGLRKEHPSGWLYLTQHDAIPILVDALLDLPPEQEFNTAELADHAGVTRQTVDNHADLLLEVELIEEVPNSSSQYRVADSDVTRELFELNSALNNVSSE